MSRLDNKRLFLLDMDGTLYKSDKLFPCTIKFLNTVKRIGAKVIYLTNNSSKSVKDYVLKLQGMGIETTDQDFVTSTMVTAEYLKKNHPGLRFYALGTRSFVNELKMHRVNATDTYGQDIEGLVLGFDTELRFEKLEAASRLLGNELPYIAANPDWCCPTDFGAVPDCGALAQMLYHATGKMPVFIGKPKPEMVLHALRKAKEKPQEALLIGDRMYTDIKCGIAAGVETALVLSGETKREDLDSYDFRPDHIFEDIGELACQLI